MREENNFNPVEPVTPVTPIEPSMEPAPMPTPVVDQTVQPVMQTPVEPQIDPSFGTNVEVPVQPVPTPTKKKNPLPIILLVLVLLAGGGFAIWKFVLPNLTGDANEKTTTEEMLAGLVDLTDSDMIAKLNDKIKIYEASSIARIDTELYKEDNHKLNDIRKRIYISYMNTKEYDGDLNNTDREFSEACALVYNSRREDIGEGEYGFTKYEDLNKTYKEIYNEDLADEKLPDVGAADEDEGRYCPSICYDAKNKEYFFVHACGGDSGVTDLSYNYKYEKELKEGNEYYYAYVAVGFIGSEEVDGEQKFYTYYSYIDTDSKEPNDDETFKINSFNYEKFDKFKYVFIKDNATGNIYVDHIERVK